MLSDRAKAAAIRPLPRAFLLFRNRYFVAIERRYQQTFRIASGVTAWPIAPTYAPDVRNQSILININGDLVPREQATVSVFDSGFILGDGIWEGLRVHDGAIPFLDKHLKRLWEGAKALDLDMEITQDALAARLFDTLAANNMTDHVHIRLMVTRGIKSTPYQDPAVTIGGPTIVIIPEYKEPDPSLNDRGVRLYTVYTRRGYADVQDPRINSHSKLNCIFGCIQAAKAGYDEALMLDPHGHVATCNSTHFFIVGTERYGHLRVITAWTALRVGT